MWRVSKAAGRPFPVLDDDDVVDYQIMEAIAIKVAKEDREEEKKVEKKQWKKDNEGLDRLRNL